MKLTPQEYSEMIEGIDKDKITYRKLYENKLKDCERFKRRIERFLYDVGCAQLKLDIDTILDKEDKNE